MLSEKLNCRLIKINDLAIENDYVLGIDEDKGYNAGYSFLGRMFGLAQVEGILATVDKELGIKYVQPGFFED